MTAPTQTLAESGAQFDRTGTYRYSLWRIWQEDNPQMLRWMLLNPSTADANADDPTIRRCIGYSKAWGFGGMIVLNLFAYRATDPDELLTVADPVGPDNDMHIESLMRNVGPFAVAGWGTKGGQRGELMRQRYPAMRVLKLTKDGHPGHPLYLRKDLYPVTWNA